VLMWVADACRARVGDLFCWVPECLAGVCHSRVGDFLLSA
jgi:hypothetical protein